MPEMNENAMFFVICRCFSGKNIWPQRYFCFDSWLNIPPIRAENIAKYDPEA
jgi:hypothetical protein